MAGTREIAQRNGLLGGRPVGSKNTPAEVKAAVLERYRERGIELADAMLEIALDKKQFSPTRITAIDKIQDRMFGKAPQPIDGDGLGGSIVLQVYTGVPEPDED